MVNTRRDSIRYLNYVCDKRKIAKSTTVVICQQDLVDFMVDIFRNSKR